MANIILPIHYDKIEQNESIQYKNLSIVPVPNAYIANINKFYRFEAQYGGRGGWKTSYFVTKLLIRALKDEYFHCIMGRETYKMAKVSLYNEMVKFIKDYHLTSVFKENRSDPYTITNVYNGNKFTFIGISESMTNKSASDALKGIVEPTHSYLGEISETNLPAIETINKTLRSPKTKCSLMVDLNPVYKAVWVRDILFEMMKSVYENDVLINKTTYLDNPFIDQIAYRKTLEASSNNDTRNVDISGFWGVGSNTDSWFEYFDENKHVKNTSFNDNLDTYIFIDENYEKFCAIVVQASTNDYTQGCFFNVVDNIVLYKVRAEQVANDFKKRFAHILHRIYLGGDQSITSNKVTGTLSETIKTMLNIPNQRMMFGLYNNKYDAKNPLYKDNWEHCNNALLHHPNIKIAPHCKDLINDLKIATFDEKAKNNPATESNKVLKKELAASQYGMGSVDCFRYAVHTLLPSYRNLKNRVGSR